MNTNETKTTSRRLYIGYFPYRVAWILTKVISYLYVEFTDTKQPSNPIPQQKKSFKNLITKRWSSWIKPHQPKYQPHRFK